MTEKVRPIEERGKQGDYGDDLVVPLDYMILDQLPDEGETFAGFYQIGTTVRDLTTKMKPLKTTLIASRMRILASLGLARSVKPLGKTSSHGAAWQRTTAGADLVSKWKEENGNKGTA